MLTATERAVLETLLTRVRTVEPAEASGIRVGDVVQLRPGADNHWATSLFLVCQIRDDGAIRGQILRPHRSGCREAWYTYRPPEVARIGCAPFPEPPIEVRAWGRLEPCPECHERRRKKKGKFT